MNQELLMVILIAFGQFIYFSTAFSIQSFNVNHGEGITTTTTNSSYLFILCYELITGCLIIYFLQLRNWRLQDLNFSLSFKRILWGIFLVLIINFFLSLLFPILKELSQIDSTVIYQFDLKSSANFYLVALVSVIINPIFEEAILIGYLGKWFEKKSPFLFVIVSILIRISYHTYQNMWGISGVVIMGLVFTIFFLKFKKLGPIIIAHVLYNLIFYIQLFRN